MVFTDKNIITSFLVGMQYASSGHGLVGIMGKTEVR
jgi:hypothetical protein